MRHYLRYYIVFFCFFITIFVISPEIFPIFIKKRSDKVNIAIIVAKKDKENKELVQIFQDAVLSNVSVDVLFSVYTRAQLRYDMVSLDKIPHIIVSTLVGEDNIDLMDLVNEYNIPLFSFSNNILLTANNNIFVFGYQYMERERFLLDHMMDLNYKDFLFLGSNSNESFKIYEFILDYLSKKKLLFHKASFCEIGLSEDLSCLDGLKEKIDFLQESSFILKKPVLYISSDLLRLSEIQEYILYNNIDKKVVIVSNAGIISDNDTINIFSPFSKNFTIKTHRISYELASLAHDLGILIGQNIGNYFNRLLFLDRFEESNRVNLIGGKIIFNNRVANRYYNVNNQKDLMI